MSKTTQEQDAIYWVTVCYKHGAPTHRGFKLWEDALKYANERREPGRQEASSMQRGASRVGLAPHRHRNRYHDECSEGAADWQEQAIPASRRVW